MTTRTRMPLLATCAAACMLASWATTATAGWIAGWDYRRPITVAGLQHATTLTDFPLLVKLDGSDGVFARAQTDGDDIAFTAADGTTRLDHEIERYDSAGQKLEAWVETFIAPGAELIYMYYGNAAAADQQNVAGTWNNDYLSVHHLHESARTPGAYNDHRDSTANNRHGEAFVSPENHMAAQGRIAGGGELDGVDDYIRVDDPIDMPNGTVSAWVKLDEIGDGSGSNDDWQIVSQDIGGYHDDILFRMDESDGNTFEMAIEGTVGGNATHAANSTTAAVPATWYLVTGTWGSGGLELYLNGDLEGTDPYTGGIVGAGHELRFGAPFKYADGLIDEIRMSTVARNGPWVKASYLTQRGHSGDHFVTVGAASHQLVPQPSALMLHLDEGNGTDAIDATGGNDGALAGGAAWTTGGKSGEALYFDGSDGRVDVAGEADFDYASSPAGFSVEAWIKPDVFVQKMAIVSKSSQSSSQGGWSLTVNEHEKLAFYLFDGASPSPHAEAATAWEADQWYHVIGTWDGSLASDAVKIYVNGILDGQSAFMNPWIDNINNDPVRVGMHHGGIWPFEGVIDEVAVFSRGLSAHEVWLRYAGVPEPSSLLLAGIGLALVGCARRRR